MTSAPEKKSRWVRLIAASFVVGISIAAVMGLIGGIEHHRMMQERVQRVEAARAKSAQQAAVLGSGNSSLVTQDAGVGAR